MGVFPCFLEVSLKIIAANRFQQRKSLPMAEQLIISKPKEAVQKLLRFAGLAPSGTRRSSTGVAMSTATCGYCQFKFSPYCLLEGITPFMTPNCLTNLGSHGAGGILTADGTIPKERMRHLREPRRGDSSPALRGVSVGVTSYPCCCCCCACPPCKERLEVGSPNRGKSGLDAAGNLSLFFLLLSCLQAYP